MSDDTHLLPWPVPEGGDSGFPQSGQIDWIAFSRGILKLAANTHARVSSAGVELLTIGAGQALCQHIRLGSLGARLVQDSVSKLKVFSFVNEVFYLGYGTKHPVRRLVETQEGLSCVALCSCLSEAYGSNISAQILMEMYKLWQPPKELTPSPKQWEALVKCCEGGLVNSSFGITISNINRLCKLNSLAKVRRDAKVSSIARALQALCFVSTGKIQSIKIIGHQECCWMAAIASWLMNLTVEVQNSSGETLYSSGVSGQCQDAQVLFLLPDKEIQEVNVVGKVYVIESGSLFIRTSWETSRKWETPIYSGGRVSWDTALVDTFGDDIKPLICGPDAPAAIALGCAARIFESLGEPVFGNRLDDYRTIWEFPYSSARGRGYLNTACRFLKELQPCRETMEMRRKLNLKEARKAYNGNMKRIAKICSCTICYGLLPRAKRNLASELTHLETVRDSPDFCQVAIIEFICTLVILLSSVVVEDDVFPFQKGIEALYMRHCQFLRPGGWNTNDDVTVSNPTGHESDISGLKHGTLEIPRTSLLCHLRRTGALHGRSVEWPKFEDMIAAQTASMDLRLLEMIVNQTSTLLAIRVLFTNSEPYEYSRRVAAFSYRGVCIVMDTLFKLSEDIEEVSRIHVFTGRIVLEETEYETVIGLDDVRSGKTIAVPSISTNLRLHRVKPPMTELAITSSTVFSSTHKLLADTHLRTFPQWNGPPRIFEGISVAYRIDGTTDGANLLSPALFRKQLLRAARPKRNPCTRDCEPIPSNLKLIRVLGDGLMPSYTKIITDDSDQANFTTKNYSLKAPSKPIRATDALNPDRTHAIIVNPQEDILIKVLPGKLHARILAVNEELWTEDQKPTYPNMEISFQHHYQTNECFSCCLKWAMHKNRKTEGIYWYGVPSLILSREWKQA